MQVLETLSCDAEFLGDRNYLHSTTILRSLQANAAALALGRFQHVIAQFHDLTSCVCMFDKVLLEGNETLTRSGYVATFRIRGEKGEAVVGLRPLDQPITRRHPFEEDALADDATIDIQLRSICLPRGRGGVLETVVSLNKRLHAALFSSAGYGKWLLTRLELTPEYFDTPTPGRVRVQMISELAQINTKAAIEVDSVPVGFVHFSRKKEVA